MNMRCKNLKNLIMIYIIKIMKKVNKVSTTNMTLDKPHISHNNNNIIKTNVNFIYF